MIGSFYFIYCIEPQVNPGIHGKQRYEPERAVQVQSICDHGAGL